MDDVPRWSDGVVEHVQNPGLDLRAPVATVAGQRETQLSLVHRAVDRHALTVLEGEFDLGAAVRLDQLVVGSVAARLVCKSDRPVLVVPTETQQ